MSDPQQAGRFQRALRAKLDSLFGSVRIACDAEGQELMRALVEDVCRETLPPPVTVTCTLLEVPERFLQLTVSWVVPE